jgi:hypothetical protein
MSLVSPIGLGLGGIWLVAAALFGLPALLCWLWNLTMPDLFRLPPLQYWQAFRLMLIASLLFGASRLL